MTYFSKAPEEKRPIEVGILGFDGVMSLDLTGPLEAFAMAQVNDEDGASKRCYDVSILGLGNRTFMSASGVVFKATKTLETTRSVDTLIIPGGIGIRSSAITTQISRWLNLHAKNVRRIVAVSSGVFSLASIGLLDGRHVTTHWRLAQAFARQFPKVRMNSAASVVKDGAFYTCGGGTAPLEMALSLIEEDYGAKVALALAREFVLDLRPPANEKFALQSFDYQLGPLDRLADLPAWILAHLRDNLSIEALAEKAGLSPRHFSRLFKQLFKRTPADFVEQLRLDEARRRLLLPRNSVAGVAASVGYKSRDAFRRAFERQFAMSPRSFRRQPVLTRDLNGRDRLVATSMAAEYESDAATAHQLIRTYS